MKNLKIQLLQALIYYWDVFFTWVDTSQLKIWYILKQKIDVENEKTTSDLQKRRRISISDVEIQKQWEELLKNDEIKGKIKIRRTSGGLK